jgi:hypothetical protein
LAEEETELQPSEVLTAFSKYISSKGAERSLLDTLETSVADVITMSQDQYKSWHDSTFGAGGTIDTLCQSVRSFEEATASMAALTFDAVVE